MPASDVPGSGAPSVVEHGCRRVHDRVVRAVRSAARRAAGGGAHDRLIASSQREAAIPAAGFTALEVLAAFGPAAKLRGV